MSPTDRFGEHHRHVDHLDLVRVLHVLFLRNGVRHHHGFERGIVDARDGRTTEDAMTADGVDFARSGTQQSMPSECRESERETRVELLLRGTFEGSTGICKGRR